MTDYEAGFASGRFAHVCDAAAPGEASCHAIIRTDSGIGRSAQPQPNSGTLPNGFSPAQLQGAYGLVNAPTTNATVAVVDAYDDPNLASDLVVYRNTFNLPACASGTGVGPGPGCITKINQNGGTSLPKTNASWGQETSLDVDMVSANCPTCHILVVETNSASFADLSAGVNSAAKYGAVAISNSYGGAESSTESNYAPAYNHPNIAVTASSGDSGYGAQSPASFGTVIATGGTSLTVTSSANGYGYGGETAWSGAGSGCSAYESQPSWQGPFLPSPSGCSNRVIADVAYDADPNTGVAVYDTFAYRGQSGWLVFGGTSVASPAIASIYARGGNLSGVPTQYTYAHASALHDVLSGSNGTCSTTYLCNAISGYDGPTGLGSPNGVGAF